MYEFPFGAGQQLNLNWIINEIITIHKQLDPDYELPNFDTAFPYMNLNTLNLDWILRELKAIKDLAPTEDATLLKMVANALLAETYDATTQYNVDDIVYRDNEKRLFKCITTTPAGGEAWDSSKWVEIDVGEVLTDLLVNGGTANAVTNVRYNNHKIQQEINGTYSDVITIEDAPTDVSDRLPSSKAVYNLNGAITSIPASRIRGKQVAIYGDSWAASYHGSLGADYITSYTGKTVHVGADPGGTLAHIYANVWDSYNADIYVIIGGLNDLGANTTLTAFQTTIYQFVNAIRAVNANAEIYFVTPPRMRTTTIHNYLYPLEAYRTVIFRRAADCQYNVINSLKWTDIAFENDNTHPVLADAPKIGKHIVDAIINYGDEETHLNDYSTVYGLLPNNVKLRCDNGALSFEFAALSVTLSSNLQYALVFPVANMGNDLLPFSFAVMAGDVEPIYVYHSGTANQIMIARKGAVTGDTLYISGAVFPIGMRATIFE